MLLLFPERNNLFPLAEHQPEKAGQGHHHVYRLIRLLILDQPDNRIQGIIQEMGIDLFL